MAFRDIEYNNNFDLDTNTKGLAAPFEDWEGDHTAFVHVVWHAEHNGWSLREDDAKIASAILHSRAMAAQKAFASRDALAAAAEQVKTMGETLSRDEVVAMLQRLAEAQTDGEN